ncbi:amidase family protein [Nonomuraea lactucae]|uniref:amidase family protein n=1 Tax=Nonomuraea lactucae TaxID=2249762 RepID=UPI000DE27FF6|nr:amidase family protein [Nonomuraea lactucae]
MDSGPLTLTTAVTRLRQGTLTSRTLTEDLLREAERHAGLGAFITLDHERALSAARAADRTPGTGLLHGVPIVVKDNIHVAGLPNTAGTPALAGFVPDADAPVVGRLRSAGAFVIGKTGMHELSFGATSAGSASGPVRNAHEPGCFAGGSSGGTAVAVAYGALAGLGTDTGGSVRIPAALNGVCGLRPTPGRYPAGAVTPLSSTRDVVGPIARTVADIGLLDAVLAGTDTGLAVMVPHRLRLGVPGGYFTRWLGAETAEAFQGALDRLRAHGVTLVDVQLPDFEAVEREIGFPITLYEARRELTAYLARYVPSTSLADLADRIIDPAVRRAFIDMVVQGAPRAIAEEHYQAALTNGRAWLRASYHDAFHTHGIDALVFPTTPRCAAALGDAAGLVDVGGEPLPAFEAFIRNTGPGSLAGLPGLTVPIPRASGGLPVGLALDGWVLTDRSLLAVGAQVQKLLAS